MLQSGTKAPDFTLNDKDGNPVTLSSFPVSYTHLDGYKRQMDASAYVPDLETVKKTAVYRDTLASDNGILWRSVSKYDKETYNTNRSDKLVLYLSLIPI